MFISVSLGLAIFIAHFQSIGEEHEKTKREAQEVLNTTEEHGLGVEKFFGGDTIGVADLTFG